MKKVLILILALLVATPVYAGVRTGDGTQNIAVAGTAVALVASSTYATTVSICADTNNSGTVSVGPSPVSTAGAQEGALLAAGNCLGLNVENPKNAFDLNEILVDSTNSGDDVSYFYLYEQSHR